MKPKAEKLRATTLKHAAALMGLPLDELEAAKAAGAPGIDSHGRVNCNVLGDWIRANKNKVKELKASPAFRIEESEANLKETQAKRAALRLEIERKKYIEIAIVAERLARLATSMFTMLRLKIENELPVLMEGKNLEERRAIGRHTVDSICPEMQAFADSWVEEEAAV